MGFQNSQVIYIPPVVEVGPIAPYYGISTLNIATAAMVTSLPNRGTPGTNLLTSWSLNAPAGYYMYYAYPASFGPSTFTDTGNGFTGGWDGANDDPWNTYGPITMNIDVSGSMIPFYVYRTDNEGLGPITWTVTAG